MASAIEIRGNLARKYADVLTPPALAAIEVLAPLDAARKRAMMDRIARRTQRAKWPVAARP
ncbi:MAG: hypothetical protein DWI58_17010 [Chloroflexi bacterium]|nr:MAG: hypothetical protein DWI58_17010 [Chloroflexota bacterium]